MYFQLLELPMFAIQIIQGHQKTSKTAIYAPKVFVVKAQETFIVAYATKMRMALNVLKSVARTAVTAFV